MPVTNVVQQNQRFHQHLLIRNINAFAIELMACRLHEFTQKMTVFLHYLCYMYQSQTFVFMDKHHFTRGNFQPYRNFEQQCATT